MKKTSAVLAMVAMIFAAGCSKIDNKTETTSPDLSIASGSMAVVVGASFTDPVGSLSTIDLNDLTKVETARVTTDGSDAVVRSFGGRIYVINRFGTDTVQVIDPANFSVIANYSVGSGTNPQDIVTVSDDKAYITRLDAQNDASDKSDVIIVNPLTGERKGGIDLKEFTTDDGDRFARAAQMVLVDKTLYICMQDLSSDMLKPADTNGKIAVVDTDTDSVTQLIQLAGRNPSDITYSPASDKLYVANTGVYDNFVVNTADAYGGIEVVGLDGKSEGIVIDDASFGGGVAEIRLASAALGFTIVDSVIIASFNPTTYEIISKELYRTSGFFLPDFSIDSNGRLLIAEQNPDNPGVVVLDAATGGILAGPIAIGAPPASITFVDVGK